MLYATEILDPNSPYKTGIYDVFQKEETIVGPMTERVAKGIKASSSREAIMKFESTITGA